MGAAAVVQGGLQFPRVHPGPRAHQVHGSTQVDGPTGILRCLEVVERRVLVAPPNGASFRELLSLLAASKRDVSKVFLLQGGGGKPSAFRAALLSCRVDFVTSETAHGSFRRNVCPRFTLRQEIVARFRTGVTACRPCGTQQQALSCCRRASKCFQVHGSTAPRPTGPPGPRGPRLLPGSSCKRQEVLLDLFRRNSYPEDGPSCRLGGRLHCSGDRRGPEGLVHRQTNIQTNKQKFL